MFKIANHSIYTNRSYAEVGQSSAVKFAAAEIDHENKVANKMFTQFKCRDFFAEFVYGSIRKVDFSIWGFSWPGSKYQVKPEITGLLVYAGAEEMETIVKLFPLFQAWEGTTPMKVTKLHDTEDPNCKLLEIDPRWWVNSFTISFYSLLIRGLIYSPKEITAPSFAAANPGSDKYMWDKMAVSEWKRIFSDPLQMALSKDTNMGWPDGTNVSTVHNFGGVYNFLIKNSFSKQNKNHQEFWKAA